MIKVIVNDYEIELFSDTVVALSKKCATIGNLQNRYSSFTNKFNVPKTRSNRSALGITQFQDNSGTPYSPLNGKIISEGIEIASNVTVIIESVSDSISLSIRAGNGSLFDRFNTTYLSDVDTSDLDKYWNRASILSDVTNDWTDGIIFPICQTGNQSLIFNTIQSKGLIPFIFCKNLFERIALMFGYTWTGSTYTNDQFEKLMIAISSLNISQRFADQFKTTASVGSLSYTIDLLTNKRQFLDLTGIYNPWSLIQTTTIVDQGNTYSIDTYKIPVPGIYLFEFDYDVTVNVGISSASILIQTLSGLFSQVSLPITFPVTTPQNFTGTISLETTLEDIYDNNAINNSPPNACVSFLVNGSDGSIFDFNSGQFRVQEIAAPETHFLRPLSIADHLPEWTIGKFVKEVGNIFGAIYDVDEYTKEIDIFRLDEISTNKNEALDWSDKLDLSKEILVTFIASGIGQTTTLQWSEFLLYSYNLNVANDQLPDNTTYIKSEADYSISAILGLQTIPVMSFDVWDFDNSRIVMDDNARFGMLGSNPGTVKIGNQISGTTSPFPFAYFDYSGSEHSLDWGILFSRYFDSLLIPMTDKIQRVTCYVRLNDVDIQKFKFKYPIFIQHFNRYFYVDEISEYTGKNQSTKIVLMGI
jgi:hypothetical protein